MNIAVMTEAEFHNMMAAIHDDLGNEIKVMRPHSISKKQAELDTTIRADSEQIGQAILRVGDSRRSTAKALAKKYFIPQSPSPAR